jgi:hypothetical protein
VTGDDKGLPATLPGVFGMAGALFMRRFTLYATLTVLAIGLQIVLDLTLLPDTGFAIGLDIILSSFIAAAVSIGVAYDLAGKDADWSRIITSASMRWGVVAIIAILAFFVNNLFSDFLTLPATDTFFGLIFLPFIVLWAAVWMGTVVAAIEPVQSRLMLPLVALGKGIGVSTQFANLGRLMLLAVLMLIVVEAELVLTNQLELHHIADAVFWAQVPLDTLTVGPLQAIATVFYVDFLRRAGR